MTSLPPWALNALRSGLVESISAAVIARSEATKQSILSLRGEMDCFASLAMTVSGRARHTSNRHRPRRRAIQYSETSVMESKSCGVLDNPACAGYDGLVWEHRRRHCEEA